MQCFFFYVISYRKKIILANIRRSFPSYTEKEVNQLGFQFYGYLTDQLVEFFRGAAMSKEELLKRMVMSNEDQVQAYINQGIPVVYVAGHQGNWEWAVHRLALSDIQHDIVYQKLSSPSFNEFTMWVRQRFGNNILLEKKESILASRERKDIPRAICLAADQSPQKPESAYWTHFLNQDTGFFTGVERFAREYNYPVFFVELIRTKRGYYTMTFEEIANPPYEELEKGAIVERFARRLEKSIENYPDQYLWSHKRWKHSKPSNIQMNW
ncbi:MAG: Kdo(2)-lipid lauroyltransferase [Bacteroidota bacterium]|jgi:KDO2-lipid IV(A) lauroyltransferase